ncbi:phage minor head protein [Gordonibacter pamelaeae]|uniref:phage minor head protein n=1 Tax=Gordonibacter pamelaeae TaxID=471189 RepID=UPI003A92A62C
MDEAHAYGDAEIEAAAARADAIYADAAQKAQGELSAHLSRFAAEDAEKAALVAAGALTAAAWASWRRRRMLSGKAWREACDRAARVLSGADVLGYELADKVRGKVYARNFDWAAAQVAKATGKRPKSPAEPPEASYAPSFDEAYDYGWNRRKVREAVNAAMARGLPIPEIAASVRKVASMDRASAVRAARTAVTSAEGAARLDVAEDAARRGLKVRLEWVSARDGRTRDSHRALDGEKVAPGERFSNGLRFPADPKGPPHEVYNCRCTLGYDIEGFPTDDAFRASKPAYDAAKPRRKAAKPAKSPGPSKAAGSAVKRPEQAEAAASAGGKRQRAALEARARSIYVEQGGHMGLSREEAERRFEMLVAGNSDAELRKYLKKHGAKPETPVRTSARPRKPSQETNGGADRDPAAVKAKKGPGKAAAGVKPVEKMGRAELEARARELYEKHGDHLGASKKEAMRRFDALVGAQSDARLRKDIARYEAVEKRKERRKGALNDENDPCNTRREAHARRYYEQVRKRDAAKEVEAVSKNAGVPAEIVEKARLHVFVNEYDLAKGHARFDEDYEMAQSWQRLRSGRGIQQHDITLLFHESHEYDLMAQGIPYEEAHAMTQRIYNYSQQLGEWKRGL